MRVKFAGMRGSPCIAIACCSFPACEWAGLTPITNSAVASARSDARACLDIRPICIVTGLFYTVSWDADCDPLSQPGPPRRKLSVMRALSCYRFGVSDRPKGRAAGVTLLPFLA
jgi:hypothetical protein